MACGVSLENAEQAERVIADVLIEVRVDAGQLHQDYEDNEIAANQKYDGKVLAVTGTIADIQDSDGDAYQVIFETSNVMDGVSCYFGRGHLDDLTSIRIGDRITVKGKGAESDDKHPFLIEIVGMQHS